MFSIFSLLCSDYVADLIKETGIVCKCGFSFTKDQIWTRPNKCALACFLLQNFVYSIDSLGESIFYIFKLKK